MESPLFLRVREAAPLLSLSRSKTYELVMRGRIGSVLIDGCRRIPREEIERFAERVKADAGLQTVA